MGMNSQDVNEELMELRGLIGDFQFSNVMYLGQSAQGDLKGESRYAHPC